MGREPPALLHPRILETYACALPLRAACVDGSEMTQSARHLVRRLPSRRAHLLVNDRYAAWANRALEGFAVRAAEAYVSAAYRANAAGDHGLAATLAGAAAGTVTGVSRRSRS
jgi:hypothetical protein